ncbi:MAG: hypothetical protein IIA64_03625 [Planctomycetes bacterium]|nr:hypothetical protein [Planctomycetota bacterium]
MIDRVAFDFNNLTDDENHFLEEARQHQESKMSKMPAFPARTVVSSFVDCEEDLCSFLRMVPYCSQHEDVWSPLLVRIMLDTCSQLDSLWGYTAWLSRFVRQEKKRRDRLTIRDYFKYFAEAPLTPLGKRWVVFWSEEPTQIRPFESWDGGESYKDLDWWKVYNKVKHDRLANREMATLSVAVHAMAGLFLAILSCEHCRYGIEAADWLTSSERVAYNPKASLGEDSPSVKYNFVAAESQLFSYPVGWCGATVEKNDSWYGSASMKFRHWFSNYSAE